MNAGQGALFGLAWGDQQNSVAASQEQVRILQELRASQENALAMKAQQDAAKAVLNAVVGEIAAGEAGKHFSDPENVRVRNEAFADTAAGQLKRLSGGAIEMDPVVTERIKTSSREVSEQLKDQHARPYVRKR